MGVKNRKVANCSSREKIDLPDKSGKLNTKMKFIFALDFKQNRLKTHMRKFTGVATNLFTFCRWQTCQTIPPPHTEYKTYVQKTDFMPILALTLAWSKPGQHCEWAALWGPKSPILRTTFHERDFILIVLNPCRATDSHSLSRDLISQPAWVSVSVICWDFFCLQFKGWSKWTKILQIGCLLTQNISTGKILEWEILLHLLGLIWKQF